MITEVGELKLLQYKNYYSIKGIQLGCCDLRRGVWCWKRGIPV